LGALGRKFDVHNPKYENGSGVTVRCSVLIWRMSSGSFCLRP
jgi:hypothetical protein